MSDSASRDSAPVQPRRSTARNAATWAAIVTIATLGAFTLSGCSSSKKSAFDGVGSPRYTGPDPIPKGGGIRKVGNSYTIAGRRYHPKVEPNYDRTGVASWYGPKFHRRATANGEWFDQDRITAAHKTLPLPSFVRVTNLKNGKSLIARLNDRGPYAHDRVIDMSKRSAELLGFRRAGTAPVRVEYLGPAPLNGDDYYEWAAKAGETQVAQMTKADRMQVAAHAAPRDAVAGTAHGRSEQPRQGQPAYAGGGLFVQAGSFSQPENAARAQAMLSGIGPVQTERAVSGPSVWYRVRLGPLADPQSADQVLAAVVDSGYVDARIVAH